MDKSVWKQYSTNYKTDNEHEIMDLRGGVKKKKRNQNKRLLLIIMNHNKNLKKNQKKIIRNHSTLGDESKTNLNTYIKITSIKYLARGQNQRQYIKMSKIDMKTIFKENRK